MTLLTAGALTDPQLPATASNVCTTDARLGGAGQMPPKQKSWLRRWRPWQFTTHKGICDSVHGFHVSCRFLDLVVEIRRFRRDQFTR